VAWVGENYHPPSADTTPVVNDSHVLSRPGILVADASTTAWQTTTGLLPCRYVEGIIFISSTSPAWSKINMSLA